MNLKTSLYRYYGLFVAAFLALVIILLPLLIWELEDWQSANILIIDQTVTDTSYRQHRAFVWTLNHLKISPSFQKWSSASDYYGFHLEKPPAGTPPELLSRITYGWGDSLELLDFSRYDLVYLTDTYGVHGYLNSRSAPQNLAEYASAPLESIPAYERFYGGINAQTTLKLVEYLRNGGSIIGEFNLFGYPTARDPFAVSILEDIFQLDHTGWLGKYFGSLEDAGEQLKQLYSSLYHLPWNFRGPGLVLACEGILNRHPPDILVFPSEELEAEAVGLIVEGNQSLTSNLQRRISYDSWFDIVRPRSGGEVVSKFRLPLKPRALPRLYSRNLKQEFPAVIVHSGSYRSIYMAGDFVDNPTRDYLSSFWGCEGFFRFFNRLGFERAYFFWNFYLPFVENALSWSLRELPEVISPPVLASEFFLWQDYSAILEELRQEAAPVPERVPPKPVLPPEAEAEAEEEKLPLPVEVELEKPPPLVEPPPVVEIPPEEEIPPDDFELLWKSAREASWSGDYRTAILKYEELLARYPGQAQPLLEYAQVLSWSRLFEESAQAYEEYLALKPNDMKATLELARVYSWMSDYKNSLKYYNIYLSETGFDEAVVFERAKVYIWDAQYEMAIADLGEILRRNPQHLQARLRLAGLYSETGRIPEAKENYLRVLDDYPENVTALVGLARLLRWQEDYSRADRNIDLALKLDPENREALVEKKLLSDIFRFNFTPGIIVERGEEYNPDLKKHYLTTGFDEYFLGAEKPSVRGWNFKFRFSRARYFEKQKFFNPDFERYNYELLSNRLSVGLSYPFGERWQIRGGLSLYSFEDGSKEVFYSLPEERDYFLAGDIYVGPRPTRSGIGVGFSQHPYVDKVITIPPSVSIAPRNTYLLTLHLRNHKLPYLDGSWQHSRYQADNFSNIAELKATKNLGGNPLFTLAGGVIWRDFNEFSEDYWSPKNLWNPYLYGGIYARPWRNLACQFGYSPGYYKEFDGESKGYFQSLQAYLEYRFTDWLKWYGSYLYAENTEEYIYRYFSTNLEIKP